MAWREIWHNEKRLGSFELPPALEEAKADRWLADLYMVWLKADVIPYDRDWDKTDGHPTLPEPEFTAALINAGSTQIERVAEDYEHVWWCGLAPPAKWAIANQEYQARREAARNG